MAALAVLGYACGLLVPALPAELRVWVDDLGQLLAAACAAGCCAVAATRSPRGRERRGWALLTAATGAWAAGQAVWSWFELVAGREVPFPSPADAGFLTFPVLAAAGLLVLPVARDAAGSRARDLLDGLVAAGSLLILSWAASLGATLTGGGPSSSATVLAVAYPLGDVVVLTLVLLVLSRAARSRRAVLVPLATGLAALAAADSTFLYLTATGAYATGNLCGIGWTAGFALVALAALAAATDAPDQRRAAAGPARDLSVDDQPDGGAPLLSRARLALPYLPLLPAQAVVTAQLLTGDRRAPDLEVAVALLLVVLVLARQAWTLTDNRALLLALRARREAARYAALHDPLTGLANRNLFADRVAHALTLRTREQATTVLFCDLDDFKTVNDGLGHAAGDALLVAVADRMRACLRPADTVARLGGDEFAVLIEGRRAGGAEPAGEIAGRLVAALGAPVALAGLQVSVSVSIGLATACPLVDDGLEAAELLRRADLAMYAAKGSDKARWVSYDPQRHALHRAAAVPRGAPSAAVDGSGELVGVPGGWA